MKELKNKKGVSLPELIISLAVFCMVSVSVLTIFSTSMLFTIRMGHKESARAEGAGTLDEHRTTMIADPAPPPPADLEIDIRSGETIGITFYDDAGSVIGSDTMPADIEFYSVEADVNGQTVLLEGFRIK